MKKLLNYFTFFGFACSLTTVLYLRTGFLSPSPPASYKANGPFNQAEVDSLKADSETRSNDEKLLKQELGQLKLKNEELKGILNIKENISFSAF